jgi:hypothetical protein
MGPLMDKLSSSKMMKNTRLNRRSSGPVLYDGFFGNQVAGEKELGSCIPTVFQGNINTILLNAVRLWRDNKYRILNMYKVHH